MTKLEKELLKNLEKAVELLEWLGPPRGYSGAEYQKITNSFYKVITKTKKKQNG